MIAWFATNRVAANLLMLAILVAGAIGVQRVQVEVFPEIEPEVVQVSVAWRGATPAEVESSIVRPIEDRVHGLDGVRRITATAVEGNGALTVEAEPGADLPRLQDEIETRISQISDLPEDSERPIVTRPVLRAPAVDVVVSWDGGADGERGLHRLARRLRDDLAGTPGIGVVEVSGLRAREIAISLDEAALRAHGLTHAAVAAALRRASRDLPAGAVRAEGGDVLVRASGQAWTAEEFAAIPLVQGPAGPLTLGQVGRVADGFAEDPVAIRHDGAPAALLRVFRTGDQNVFDVVATVRARVAALEPGLPQGAHLAIAQDNSGWLRQRLDLLLGNAWMSLGLVFGVLALTMGLRLSFWVSAGIPLSFAGALATMPLTGTSVNMVSLFAFILVLGIVVDDAIVVGDAVEHDERSGIDRQRAAIGATRLVAIPVACSVLTTVAAFLPMWLLPGSFGKIFSMIPAVVIPVLLFSLVESMLILPHHLAHGILPMVARVQADRLERAWAPVVAACNGGLDWFARRVYARSLLPLLRWRWATIAAFLAVCALTFGLLAGGRIPTGFFPRVEGDVLTCDLALPAGAAAADTARAVAVVERAAERLRQEAPGMVRAVTAMAGQRRAGSGPSASSAATGSEIGQVSVELAPAQDRAGTRWASSEDLAKRWRELAGTVPDAVAVSFNAAIGGRGKDIAVRLTGDDLGRLRAAADDLRTALALLPGTVDLGDNLRPGKAELRLALTPAGAAAGLDLGQAGAQVRAAIEGAEVQRFSRGGEEVRVIVRLPGGARSDAAALDRLMLDLPGGGRMPASTALTWTPGTAYAAIRRTDRVRSVEVSADIDPAAGNADAVRGELRDRVLPALAEAHGVRWSFEGATKDQAEQMRSLGLGFLGALVAIFALIALPLSSWSQPLLIMTTIPMGLVAAVLAHAALGMTVSIMSIIGMVALSGVVVNDAIVLVDYVNQRRAAGERIARAVVAAGVRRFRPVMLTTLTTFAGLAPLLLETSPQAMFLIPTVVSLAFGVLIATLITLVLLPALYLVREDLRRR